MNMHKLRRIVNHIRRQGPLPTDPYDQFLPIDEMIAWFGLTDRLSGQEIQFIKKELSEMVEAELLLLELEAERF